MIGQSVSHRRILGRPVDIDIVVSLGIEIAVTRR
jgi:hypothetical protein